MIVVFARRALVSISLLVIVPAITFFLQAAIPGSAAISLLGINATAEQRTALIHKLGLDQPIWTQYIGWLGKAVHGNLGTSLLNGQEVTGILNSRLEVSLSLIIGATLVSAIIGVLLGVWSATGGERLGRFVNGFSVFGAAVPNFWLGVVLIEVFAVALHFLPAGGYVPISQSVGSWALALILPVLALAMVGITTIAKQTRAQMLEVMQDGYILNQRANGLTGRTVIFRHALRNAAVPIVTVIGLVFVGSLSGSIIVETVFVLPGLGSQAVQATESHDFPVVQGISVYFTIVVVIVNILVDIAYTVLNPRLRTR